MNDLISKIKILHGLKKKEIKNYSSNKSAMKLHDAQPGTISKKNATVDEDLYFRWFEKLERLSDRRERYSEMLSQTNTLLAFVHIRRYIDRYRVDNNMILISDTNSLLSSIVTESDTPFIYERVGMSLENFLIDEFQDTSRQQWRSLRPLVANSGIDADSLIIGDVKQSIYRWRGGDPLCWLLRSRTTISGKQLRKGRPRRRKHQLPLGPRAGEVQQHPFPLHRPD